MFQVKMLVKICLQPCDLIWFAFITPCACARVKQSVCLSVVVTMKIAKS